jgi:hypothetical protein
MANNLFDYFKDFQNPFAGVGETFKEMNIFGVTTPESVKQMESLGLLESDQIQAAKTRGLRDAIVQGLIHYGGQDFNKNLGTAFAPAYLLPALGVAMKTAQEPVSALEKDVLNLEKLKAFKRETEQGQKVREILSGGIYQDGKFNTSVVDDLIKAGDYKTADAISTIIARKQAAIKTLADTHERKEGKGGVIYYIPKGDGVSGVYMLDKSGNIVPASEGYIPKPDIRSVGEGGLYDINKGEQVVGGSPSLPTKPKTITKSNVIETKKLIQGLYPQYAIENYDIDNTTAVLIANRAETIKSRKGNKGMGQEEAVKLAIEELDALHQIEGFFGDTFDFGKPNYEIRQPEVINLNELPK